MEELLRIKLEEGSYYFQKHNVFIRSKITKYRLSKTDYMTIEFESGHIDVHDMSQINKISRPLNIMIPFDWCFLIKNSDGEFIGYIGKPSTS